MQVANSVIIISFAMIGSMLKYVDIAYDENMFGKTSAALAGLTALLAWLFISFIDTVSANILLAVLLGSLFSGKLDNVVFKLSAAVILLFSALYVQFDFIVLFFLSVLGIIDEKGNDKKIENKIIGFLFSYRFAMKAGVLALLLLSRVRFVHFAGFMLFDLFYDILAQKAAKLAVEEGN